jgi:preprotein translocase subunit SecG
MSLFIIVIHVIVCIALIMIVLLQTGKGADMGAAFGGGSSQTLFGSTGASSFLSKATTAVAVLFMLTSLILAYMSGNTSSKSIVMDAPAPVEQTQPASETAPEAPALPADTTSGEPTKTE